MTAYRYSLDDERPSEGTCYALAALTDRPPLDLPPLGEAIDPHALDRLVACDDVSVSFRYCGHAVTATADEIRVTEEEADASGRSDDPNS